VQSTLISQAFSRYTSLISANSISVSPPHASYPDLEGVEHPFYKSIFGLAALPVLESLVVQIASVDETLQYGVDESYFLNGKRKREGRKEKSK
jgi:hypothetical protein